MKTWTCECVLDNVHPISSDFCRRCGAELRDKINDKKSKSTRA